MNLEEKQICPALNEFRLTGWDGSETVSDLIDLVKIKREHFLTRMKNVSVCNDQCKWQ